MSTKAVNQFLIKVSESKELKKKVVAIERSGYDSQAMVKLATEYGYEFTVKELESEIANSLNQIEIEKLSDAELEAVSGGKLDKVGKFLIQTGMAKQIGVWMKKKKPKPATCPQRPPKRR